MMARAAPTVWEVMRTRRVVRSWSNRPIARETALRIIRAARWAPAAGNRRVQRYVAVGDRQTIGLIRAVSPGISGYPAAIVLICVDRERAARMGARSEGLLYLDVGTAAQNMLLAAHALGIGAGPVTSFSAEAVRVILGLPHELSPAVMICLGYPGDERPIRRVRPDRPVRLEEFVSWEHFDDGGASIPSARPSTQAVSGGRNPEGGER